MQPSSDQSTRQGDVIIQVTFWYEILYLIICKLGSRGLMNMTLNVAFNLDLSLEVDNLPLYVYHRYCIF